MQLTNGEPRSGHCLQLLSRPPDGLRQSDWPIVLSCSVVIQAPVEEVNSDGKANLDILSTVKYGKELLNEQLIPQRYHVPAHNLDGRKGKITESKREQINNLIFLNVAWVSKHLDFLDFYDISNREKFNNLHLSLDSIC